MRIHPLLIVAALALLGGCGPKQPATVAPVTQVVAPAPSNPIRLADITEQAGIRFVHNNGAFGAFLMPEIMGSGAAFIDYDGDGYPDIFFVNGRDWTAAEVAAYKNGTGKSHPELFKNPRSHKPSTCALYHNNGNGTFTDVTAGSGLNVEMYGMGVTVGDYDNDGKPDLYVTALGRNYLFRNLGGGKFADESEKMGVKDGGWSTSACWVDYDKDGKLDLFVCHYVDWSPDSDVYCQSAGHNKDYCTPEAYKGEYCRLYHNLGNRFEDVSAKAGLLEQKTPGGIVKNQGKSLGVAVCDVNGDGWPDIIVSNDTERNYLFQNNGNGTFNEQGQGAGIAFSEAGLPRAAMGVDTSDIDHTGKDSILFGNFSNQMLSLYQPSGNGLFIDAASQSGIGQPSLKFLAFGTLFCDLDNDGWPDIFVANGHVENEIASREVAVTFKERPLLFHNDGKARFTEVGLQAGDGLKREMVGRGTAAADIDLDGYVDVLLTANGDRPALFHNLGGRNGAIRLVLEGTKSNRSAIGAIVEVKVGGDSLRRVVRSGSSYCSACELPLTIGLGQAAKADSVTISWPSGAKTNLQNVAAGQIYQINEDKGIVKQQPFPGKK